MGREGEMRALDEIETERGEDGREKGDDDPDGVIPRC